MGILSDVKNYMAKKAIAGATKIGNGIATLSTLSPDQVKKLENKRNDYLAEMANMTSQKTESIVQRNMGAIAIEVYQAYLEQLKSLYCPVTVNYDLFNADNRIRFFDITKWVTDADEKYLEKLVNVYHVLSEEDCNIALIYNRTKVECRITIGIVNTSEQDSDPAIADEYCMRVLGAIKGNFPGSEISGFQTNEFDIGIPISLENIVEEKPKSIAIVSNVASEKSEDFISQSMEKLLDGIVPKDLSENYTVVLLAKPITQQLQNKNRLFELYTALAPYANWQHGFSVNEMSSENSTAILGVTAGVGFGTHSSLGFSASIPKTGVGMSTSTGTSTMANFGVNFARASSMSVQVGKNTSVTQSFTNFSVQHTLDIIKSQIARIEESSALGMWDFAAYVISESPVIANNVAHMYLALTQGETSYLTKSAVNFWDGEVHIEATKNILESITRLQHPVFGLKTTLEDEWLMYPLLVTPTLPLTGKELAKALNFPRKSVSGFPVLEVVAFGREPHSLSNDDNLNLEIGSGYHMRKVITGQRIKLSKEELTKHTFIAGSTGSGKSNTIYKLLENLGNEDVKFLIIEPSKGEYKEVIGKNANVRVYGTNPNLCTKLLNINPFRFPVRSIHILEHLDRLVEIFNVCWPMYAAMPAILKDSIERAYISSGWDIESSVNRYDNELFPTFADVVKEIRKVLNESDYSNDNKGDYTGSLVTRLRSLTNGINGLIFSSDDVTDTELFDKNAIIDLSRIGSSETKSLIMGLLVLKLQEYRMDQRKDGEQNIPLRHITVLEEAHNLLKRTSVEQSSEGANLIGKSVEMLANAIAEMRTYGEGFIIADQSPGLLDMSVIRNTNTKIILRLPEYSDRLLVGRAAGLNDNQIIELAKLEKGVAVISQSNWLEPVLCKIDKYVIKNTDFNFYLKPNKNSKGKSVSESLLHCIMNREIYRRGDRVDIKKLKDLIIKSRLDTSVKCDFLDYITAGKEDAIESLRILIYDFLNAEEAIKKSKECKDIITWVHSVKNHLNPSVKGYTQQQIDLVMGLIIYEQTVRDNAYENIFCRFTELYMQRGRV